MLTYAYAPDMTERRTPHREAHLEHLRQAKSQGLVLLAGAFADPVDGALLVCQADGPADVYAWVARDPYNKAGLIQSASVREINVAIQPG
ncbi:MAG: hypothetical protein JOZ81_32585 [Chloroflexi bacterium]|nr:hypothetical protein [Chloroflexota bacterium]MBV9546565.1 hypothetical protein [Chloroflexota bacterium]